MAFPNLDPIIVDNTTTVPETDQLTTMSVDGTGVFDILMKTIKLHLQEEYDAGRITGEAYTTVYLGALNAVMQQSIAFLATQQNGKKIDADIGLTRQRTVTELTQTDNDIPLDLGFNGSVVVEGMVASQLAINALQADLVTSQIATDAASRDLVGQKVVTELGQTDVNLVPVKAAGHGFNAADVIDGGMRGNAERSQAEADLTIQKLVTEIGQTSTTKPNDLGMVVGTVLDGITKGQTDLLVSQVAKTNSEVTLVSQKAITELSQTSDTVVTGTPALTTSTVVTGTVDKQKSLYVAQTDGFTKDAVQKLVNSMTDAWKVDATVSGATANATNHLRDEDLGAVIVKAMEGIDVTVP